MFNASGVEREAGEAERIGASRPGIRVPGSVAQRQRGQLRGLGLQDRLVRILDHLEPMLVPIKWNGVPAPARSSAMARASAMSSSR